MKRRGEGRVGRRAKAQGVASNMREDGPEEQEDAMDFGIETGKDVKLNVRPVTVCVYHEYVFEGPCRFGEGDRLTKEFERWLQR